MTLVAGSVFACLFLNGCLMVGYSSRGGGFIFPGGLGLIAVLVVLFLFMRRR